MYKLCKTEQSANRQRELEMGLLVAMASCHYDEITISDLCQRMGIPRKSFYRYFSGKDGALHALIDHTLMEYEGIFVPQIGRNDSTQQQLESFFEFWRHHQNLLNALQRSALSGVLIERSISHALQDNSISGHFHNHRERIEVEHATMFAICGLMSMMLQWHKDGYREPVGQMAAIAVRLLTKPLYQV